MSATYPPPGPSEPPPQPTPHGPPAQYGQPPAPYGPAPYTAPPVWQPPPDDPLVSPDYGGWWRRSLAILRRAWPYLLMLEFAAAVVSTAVQTPLALMADRVSLRIDTSVERGTPDFRTDDLFVILGSAVAVLTIGVAVGAVVSLATLRVSFAAAIGAPVGIGQGLATAGRRFLPLLGWYLLALPMILAGICVCLVPGLYFAAVLAVLPAVVVFERGAGIGRCFKLFHGRFGSSLARMGTILVMYPIVGGITTVIATVIEDGFHGTNADDPRLLLISVITTAVASFGFAALSVLTTPLLLTAYADMRARVEPFATATLLQPAA